MGIQQPSVVLLGLSFSLFFTLILCGEPTTTTPTTPSHLSQILHKLPDSHHTTTTTTDHHLPEIPKLDHLQAHLANLTGNLNMTSSNRSAWKHRWDHYIPKPSTNPDIKDVPSDPLSVSKEEWEKLMPLPLRRDLSHWLDSGYNSSLLFENCTMPGPAVLGVMFQGVVYYMRPAIYSIKYQWFHRVMSRVATLLNQKYPDLPVIRFAFSISSVASLEFAGTCPEGMEPGTFKLPYLVLAKRKGDPTRLVRMPTPYLNPTWTNEADRLYREKIPWHKKRTQACWLGASNSMPGGRSRLMLLAEVVRLTRLSPVFKKFFHVHTLTPPVKRFKAWREIGWFDNATFELLSHAQHGGKQAPHWFGKCKYNFHLPGHTKGGYSRALQNLLPQGTAVLKYESDWEEFYYDWLVRGTHYIPYTNETLQELSLYLLKHDKEGEAVAEAGLAFYKKYLNWDNLARYWEWMMLTLLRLDTSERQIMWEVPEGACQCFLEEKWQPGRCKFCAKSERRAKRRAYREKKRLAKAMKRALEEEQGGGENEEDEEEEDMEEEEGDVEE